MSVAGNKMAVINGKPPDAANTSSSPSSHEVEEVTDKLILEDPPVDQIERDLDELTFSGAAINDLEVQLIRAKDVYQKILVDGRNRVDTLRRKLHTHIVKSEPYIEIWRRAKQIQEATNKAAARYDKVNSQHTAAKEMIRVAESQLAACREELKACEEEPPSSPSPLDLAWQEMLNHATDKVVMTAKERRDSELEHLRVMEECNRVMEQYKAIERRLHTNIVKSRPYFEERYRVNQLLTKHRALIKELEQKIDKSKKSYSASLKRLEVLNTEIHERRNTISKGRNALDSRRALSTGNSPEMLRKNTLLSVDKKESLSMDSLQMSGGEQFGGSPLSFPSMEPSSSGPQDMSPGPSPPSLTRPNRSPPPPNRTPPPPNRTPNKSPSLPNRTPPNRSPSPSIQVDTANGGQSIDVLASELVAKSLASAFRKLQLESQTSPSLPSSLSSPSSPSPSSSPAPSSSPSSSPAPSSSSPSDSIPSSSS